MLESRMVATRTELVAETGIVAGGDPAETAAGVRALEQGGNAVDAIVAAAFTAFVVEPASCGLGGYGRLALFLAHRRELVTVQGDETFVDARIAPAVRERLAELGHRVVVQHEAPGQTFFGRVVAIRRDAGTGLLHAGSGPAWSTAAAGF